MVKNNNKNKNKRRNSKQNKQKGGRVTMPSEYFGNDSGRYFQNGAPELQMANSAYGKNHPTSRGVLIADNLSGPDLGATRHSGMQTGGAEFQYIVNPETGRKVSIHGKTGQKVLKNYVNNLYN